MKRAQHAMKKENFVELNKNRNNKSLPLFDICINSKRRDTYINVSCFFCIPSFSLSFFKLFTLSCVCENASEWIFVKKVLMMTDFIRVPKCVLKHEYVLYVYEDGGNKG